MALRTPPRRTRFKCLLLYLVLAALVWALFLSSRRPTPTPDPNYGLLRDASLSSSSAESGSGSTSPFAFATFLSGDDTVADKKDNYFRAVRLLTYQLLHAPETRSNSSIPFVVLVTKQIPLWKRDELRRHGATVVEAEDVPLTWWIKTGVTRWKDQFTKLRLLQMTQYSRILFIDADTLITKPLDAIFDEPGLRRPSRTLFEERRRQIRSDEALLPANYVFAARSDNQLLGKRDHEYPPGHTEVFSAGFWVAAPSKELYTYLMSVMSHWRRFDPHTMEQSLLNYAFRRSGAMPWTELDPKWSATWPNPGDLDAGVASLHEKFWKTGPKPLRELYIQKRDEAEDFFDAREKKRP